MFLSLTDRRGDRPQFGSDRRDDRGSQFGYQDLASKILQIQSKRFYIDVKENRRGRFIKLSEVRESKPLFEGRLAFCQKMLCSLSIG